jgi:hypothetical protein
MHAHNESKIYFRVFMCMKPLYTEKEFDSAKSTDKLPCQCLECNNVFYKEKRVIKRTFTKYDRNTGDFCSKRCANLAKGNSQIVLCTNCSCEFRLKNSSAKGSKSGNHFCSQSCAATYNNTHKIKGCRRSKLEKWLEVKLKTLYPNIEILFNNKTVINSELDIYIPSFKLAFELNGIFHYEPIYGQEKLSSIQNNDKRKFQVCLEHNIELCIIDTSQQKYFKEQNSEKYLNIITNIINTRQ